MKVYFAAVSGGNLDEEPWIDVSSRNISPSSAVRPSSIASVSPATLPAGLRRRASPLTKEVSKRFFRVCQQSNISPESASLVLASDLGEISTTVRLLQHMANGDAMSPTGFHNSVHNTATGYLSIATENHEPSTTITAGANGFAMALLEASTQIECGCEHVIVIVAEEELPLPVKNFSSGDVYSIAFALTKVSSESGVWLKIAPTLNNDADPNLEKTYDFCEIQGKLDIQEKQLGLDEHPGLVAVQQAMECGYRFERGMYGNQRVGAFSSDGSAWLIETGQDLR